MTKHNCWTCHLFFDIDFASDQATGWVARRSRIVYAHPTCVWTCMAALPSAHNSFNRTRGWRKQTERKKEYDENKNKERRCSESVVCIATTGKCERVARLL